jgi:TonB family protein
VISCARTSKQSVPSQPFRNSLDNSPAFWFTLAAKSVKRLTTIIAITVIAFTARASEPVPYIAMPIDKGYAINAQGKRQSNALCAHDVVWACPPRYPLRARSSDPTSWSRNFRGDGLYRLDIDLKTGRVSRTTIIKSTGSATLDRASTWAFNRWRFTPGKWSAMVIPTTVRVTWVPVIIQERELN